MKKTKVIALILLSHCYFFGQKEYSFVSTGQQKLIINPAFAGSSKGLTIQSVLNPYLYTNSYTGLDYGFKKGLGLGLAHSGSNMGNKYYSSHQLDFSASFQFRFKNVKLIPSLQASYLYRQYLSELLVYYDGCFPMPDPIPYPRSGKTECFSLSGGLMASVNNNFTFGAALYDFNKPDVGFHNKEIKQPGLVVHVSGVLFKDKTLTLQPYAMARGQNYTEKYYEIANFTSLRGFSFQSGIRNYVSYNENNFDATSLRSNLLEYILGLSYNYKGFKAGSTCFFSESSLGLEFYATAHLFSKEKKSNVLLIN
jgi:hypothetical protein